MLTTRLRKAWEIFGKNASYSPLKKFSVCRGGPNPAGLALKVERQAPRPLSHENGFSEKKFCKKNEKAPAMGGIPSNDVCRTDGVGCSSACSAGSEKNL